VILKYGLYKKLLVCGTYRLRCLLATTESGRLKLEHAFLDGCRIDKQECTYERKDGESSPHGDNEVGEGNGRGLRLEPVERGRRKAIMERRKS
jgi:hypothetical protein